MVAVHSWGGLMFVLTFSIMTISVGTTTTETTGPPKLIISPDAPPVNNCCPHNTLLDPVTRKCSAGEAPVLDCGGNTKFLIDFQEENPPFEVTTDGFLRVGKLDVPSQLFCLANLTAPRQGKARKDESKNSTQIALACMIEGASPVQIPEIIMIFLYCMSIVSLILVLLAYIVLPELRCLQGKCHMGVVLGLLFGLSSLLIVQTLNYEISELMCQALAFSVYFWMLSAFFWLNVTAFNVWRSALLFHVRIDESRLFIGYSVYAWGAPISLLALTATMHFLPEGYAVLRPHFGLNTCWFHDSLTVWSFFYGPVALLLLVNCFFFIWTTIYLWMDYSTTCLPVKRRLKRRCLLSIRMYLVMGIGWIFELISSLDDDDSILWLVLDAFNILQGVAILLVLIVFRRKFWCEVHNKRPYGLVVPNWAVKMFLADDQGILARNMEELKHLKSSDAA